MRGSYVFFSLLIMIAFVPVSVQAQGAYTEEDYIAQCQESRALNYPDARQCKCVLNVHSSEQDKSDLGYIAQNIEKFEKRATELESFFITHDVLNAQKLETLCVFSQDANAKKARLQRRFDEDPSYRATESGREDLQEIFEIEQSIRKHYVEDLGREMAMREQNRVFGAGQKAMQYCQYSSELYLLKQRYNDIVNGVPEFNSAGHVLRQKFRQCIQ